MVAEVQKSSALLHRGFYPLTCVVSPNIALFGAPTNRELSVHFVSIGHLWQLVGTVASWFCIPAGMPRVITVASLILLSIVMGWCLWETIFRSAVNVENADPHESTPTCVHIFMLLVFALTYLGFLIFSISFIDANMPLDNRILSPIFVFGFLLISIVYIKRWREIWKHWFLALSSSCPW
jgi:hypothetical protein